MVETIEFNGIRFRRYPESKRAHLRKYYWPGISHRMRGVGALHQEVWRFYNGPYDTSSFHIHHVDENTLNNDILNLEKLPAFEHLSMHSRNQEYDLGHLARIRPLTRAWHASAEGRMWHRSHAKSSLEKSREPTLMVCEECRTEFISRSNTG